MYIAYKEYAPFKQYIKEIEYYSNFKLTDVQKEEIKKYIRENADSIYKLSPAEARTRRWSSATRRRLINEWQINTGQTWPIYAEDKLSKKGDIYIEKGEFFDAHEVIPNQLNAPHEWWNIMPAERPNAHQAGIHRAEGAFNRLIKWFKETVK